MDHWGLLNELPSTWPVHAGAKTAELVRLNAELFGPTLQHELHGWPSSSSALSIGRFTVTPLLTDHSALDAYMLLIEGCGKRILYTGDFRTHGRKAVLVERMLASPPKEIDVLIMEGTNLGTAKPTVSESQLEAEFVSLAAQTQRHVFVYWSAQNVDRTVTLYRAAKRTGRKLVVDLYTADVLERIASGTAIPRPEESSRIWRW